MSIPKINIIYLLFVFIWQAIQLNFLQGLDGAGRINTIVAFLILILNISKNNEFRRNFVHNKSVIIWLFWFIYAVINSVFLFDENIFNVSLPVFISNRLFVPFVIITIVASFKEYFIDRLFRFMMIGLYFVAIIFLAGSDFVKGRYEHELFNINELILIIVALIATIFIIGVRSNISISKIFLLMILPSYFVVMSGSRMGFGAYVILFLGFWYNKRVNNKFIFVFQAVIVVFICFVFFQFLIDNTVLGERLATTSTQSEELVDNAAEGTIFEYLGDRGVFYVNGWRLFIESPIFGVGLLNYNKYNTYVCHVEFIVHLAELGLIGFVLYLLFLLSLLNNVFKKMKLGILQRKNEYILSILFCLIFCALVLFLYNSYAVSYLYGLIILLSNNKVDIYNENNPNYPNSCIWRSRKSCC